MGDFVFPALRVAGGNVFVSACATFTAHRPIFAYVRVLGSVGTLLV